MGSSRASLTCSVKKPYNPILNEFYRCTYYYPDGSQGYYVAEQVSHHPVSCSFWVKSSPQPISAFFYVSPKNGILVTGELKPKSKFLGNSAATIMEGEDRIRFLNRPDDGEYCISVSRAASIGAAHTLTHRCPTLTPAASCLARCCSSSATCRRSRTR